MDKTKINKKRIDTGVATRGLIIGFLSYGILLAFIFFSLMIYLYWKIDQSSVNQETVKYTTAVCSAFIMFFLIRLVCKLCTFDMFRNYKIKITDVNTVSSRMNLFFIICVIFSIFFSFLILKTNLNSKKIDILKAEQMYYSQHSEQYAEYLTERDINEYRINRSTLLIQMFIIESGVIFGLFSLTTIQKNLIEKYNDTSEDEEIKKSE